MHWSGPVQGPSPEWRRAIFCGVLFLFFSPTFVHGQDVAEAARQEQARKAEQQKTPPHVYTEEDLKRKKILTPEDQARVEARKKEMEKAPAQVDAEQLPRNDGSSETESLGEVARRYRREKEAREAVEAEEKKFAPFPYKVPESSLAVVKPEVAPAARISPRVNLKNGASPMPALAPHSSPSATAPHARVSPFQRRPLVGAPPARVLAPFVAHSAAAPVSNSAMPVIAPAATSSEVAATPSRSSRVSRPAPVNPLPSPVKAGMQRVQVERGESWWRLARRYLGSGTRWTELRTLNAEASGPPEFLMLGSTVLVPEKGRVEVRQSSPGQSITVKKGDSLWALAREHFGHGSAWTCLAGANPQIRDYSRMRIGMKLQLPEGEALEACQTGKIDKFQR